MIQTIQPTPVILCGGSGTRLWPLSRTGFPKQFMCPTGNESLFQQAALRLARLGNTDIQVASPIIITGEDHRFLASEQLREIGIELGCAFLEPVCRNTAPALTLAALATLESGADPTEAKDKLGLIPKTTFDELVAEMVREDLKSAERDEFVKHHGYNALDCYE